MDQQWPGGAVGQVSLAAAGQTVSMYADEPGTVSPTTSEYGPPGDRLASTACLFRERSSSAISMPLEIKDHKGKIASNECFRCSSPNPVDCIVWRPRGQVDQ